MDNTFFKDTVLPQQQRGYRYYWEKSFECYNLTEEQLEELTKYINDQPQLWQIICYNNKLSEDFMRKHADQLNWNAICVKQNLSEAFMREFRNMLDWACVCQYQKLSKNFIKEFLVYMSWNLLSEYQDYSLDFVKEFKDKMVWFRVSNNKNFTNKEKNDMIGYLNNLPNRK